MQEQRPHAKICGAKTRSGEPCKNAPMSNGRCRMHGGKSLRGIDSPSAKTLRHSKYMPKRILDIYQNTTQDPELLSLHAEIALTDALLADMLPNLETGESKAAWKMSKKLIREARKAYNNEDLGTMLQAFKDMEDLADARILHYDTVHEIKDTIDTRRRLVETQQKVSLQGERSISVDRLMILMTQVLHVIQTVVTDEKDRYAIATQLQSILSVPESDTISD